MSLQPHSKTALLVNSNDCRPNRQVEVVANTTAAQMLAQAGWSEGGVVSLVNPQTGNPFSAQDRPFNTFSDGATLQITPARHNAFR